DAVAKEDWGLLVSIYSRRQLLANAAIAASPVPAYPCVGGRPWRNNDCPRPRGFPGGRISVEVRIRTDIHPTIVGVPHDARIRVVRRIVVGIGRRETQTYACYERKAKAPPPKPCSDRSGAKAWSDRGGAKGRADGRATKAGDNGGATKAVSN